ncbi:MAG: hypothetical protein ACT4OX_16095 [Actinomycetota bacterium]
MPPRDTGADALSAQSAILMRLTGSERARIAFDLSEVTRDVARAGTASRHPGYDALSTELALFRLLHGDNGFLKAWPGQPLLHA